ncbi:TonB-dependent receptor [Granulicella cerasi]|uniref:TonB-dependent receptor n=1 Tax=Granulicella cerasi TaxID=741063 RepID=UPI0021DFF720|nr:TonB-dependent receptor [Granulicella cerasi]
MAVHKLLSLGLALAPLLLPPSIRSQQPCANGIHVDGTVTDTTGAVVPGAELTTTIGERTTSDSIGHYTLTCVTGSSALITARATGFAESKVRVRGQVGSAVHMNIELRLASVQQDVEVNGDVPTASEDGAGTTMLNAKQVEQLPDDPDDLLRELQMLASTSGGSPNEASVLVNGFQGSSMVPPKSSIASIRINPDTFSPEFQWHRSRIEITTKPGADKFHGALFFNDSNSIFNATNPFSTTSTPAGRRRYGVELTGPIRPKKLDFTLAVERREIDEFDIVNAKVLDSSYSVTPLRQTVATPQKLWIGSARIDSQFSKNDIATLSWSANVNDQGNQGVGGLVLQEAGYSNRVSEYDLRLLNTLTLGTNTVQETRIGFAWKRNLQKPNSTSPSLQVAGYFTGGGAISQNLNNRERDLEVDDDVIATRGRHQFDFGLQSITSFVHAYVPSTFNGDYVFGGGSGSELDSGNQPTGGTVNLRPIDQYGRALQNLPGGTPTNYQVTMGNPVVPVTQSQVSLYAQDVMKVLPNLSFTFGLRYQLEIHPNSFHNPRPRFGLVWSPDKKATWTIGAQAGIFTIWDTPANLLEVERLNGSRQSQITVYSPSYRAPLVPVPGSIQVNTRNRFEPGISQAPVFQFAARVAHEFPHHWSGQVSYSFGGTWNSSRIVNINAPKLPSSIGIAPDPTASLMAPRPLAPNLNIMQYQNYGHGQGAVYAATVKQNSLKRLNLNVTYWYLNFRENPQTPQSTYSTQGDSARPDWMRRGGVSGLGVLQLPSRFELSMQFSALPGLPYNITTGTDANGDGVFNDRPSYAAAVGTGVYSTPYGLMTTNTVNGTVPYNVGTMPGWTINLDPNLRRTFVLNPKDRDHLRTLSLNVRSSNVLNHTNVTTVNTVLSSGTVGQPIAAGPARRLELGARFDF